jgi:hypothetical protein
MLQILLSEQRNTKMFGFLFCTTTGRILGAPHHADKLNKQNNRLA